MDTIHDYVTRRFGSCARGTSIAAVALALALSSAIATGADQEHGQHGQMGQSSSMSGMDKMSSGSQKMHQAMMMGMQDMKMTGDTDQDFASMMIHHHQQAIAMARAQLEHGKSSELRTRAQKIIDDSQKDIDALEKWRKSGAAKDSAAKR